MRIMSFNTQHCRNFVTGKIDFNIMADAIKACDADIVGLNEIRGRGVLPHYENQTAKLAALSGIDNYYFAKALNFAKGGPYGNALLSKIPIIKAEKVMISEPKPRKYKGHYEPRCVLKAELEGGITVLVTHFGLNPDEQENAVETVLKCLSSKKCILMGDFNVSPKNAVLKPIRKRMRDTAELFEEPLLSYPSDAPKTKIDYIFVSDDIEVVSADIPAIIASDHRPHIAEVR